MAFQNYKKKSYVTVLLECFCILFSLYQFHCGYEWKLENSLWELILSLHHMLPGMELSQALQQVLSLLSHLAGPWLSSISTFLGSMLEPKHHTHMLTKGEMQAASKSKNRNDCVFFKVSTHSSDLINVKILKKNDIWRGTVSSPCTPSQNLVQQNGTWTKKKENLKIWKTGRSCSLFTSGENYQTGIGGPGIQEEEREAGNMAQWSACFLSTVAQVQSLPHL